MGRTSSSEAFTVSGDRTGVGLGHDERRIRPGEGPRPEAPHLDAPAAPAPGGLRPSERGQDHRRA